MRVIARHSGRTQWASEKITRKKDFRMNYHLEGQPEVVPAVPNVSGGSGRFPDKQTKPPIERSSHTQSSAISI